MIDCQGFENQGFTIKDGILMINYQYLTINDWLSKIDFQRFYINDWKSMFWLSMIDYKGFENQGMTISCVDWLSRIDY